MILGKMLQKRILLPVSIETIALLLGVTFGRSFFHPVSLGARALLTLLPPAWFVLTARGNGWHKTREI